MVILKIVDRLEYIQDWVGDTYECKLPDSFRLNKNTWVITITRYGVLQGLRKNEFWEYDVRQLDNNEWNKLHKYLETY